MRPLMSSHSNQPDAAGRTDHTDQSDPDVSSGSSAPGIRSTPATDDRTAREDLSDAAHRSVRVASLEAEVDLLSEERDALATRIDSLETTLAEKETELRETRRRYEQIIAERDRNRQEARTTSEAPADRGPLATVGARADAAVTCLRQYLFKL